MEEHSIEDFSTGNQQKIMIQQFPQAEENFECFRTSLENQNS